jgi:phage-related protein
MARHKKRRPQPEQQLQERRPPEPFQVVFFQEDDGTIPLLDWLDQLKPAEALAKCRVVIGLLREQGNQLRRPHADILRDGIWELRTKLGRVRYRLLYFFHGRVIVLTHGFAKQQSKVPPGETKRAIACRERYLANPEGHSHRE